MGGKVWSEEEERVFWTEIVPSSTKRHLLAKPYTHDAQGWEALRKVMQTTMGRRARRKYTSLMLYEHYFQNSVLERFSPNATKFVREYIKKELFATGQAPSERSRSIMRYIQRGSGSGRRPKKAGQASQMDMQSAMDAFSEDQAEDGTPIPDQVQDSVHVQPPALAQDTAQDTQHRQRLPSTMERLLNPVPHDLPTVSRELPPLTAPVRLPPLAPMEPQLSSLDNSLSALCEPDYDYTPLSYQQPAYQYQASYLETSNYQDAGCHHSPAYQTASSYDNSLYQPAPFQTSAYPTQSYQTPVEATEDSMFMKQEPPYVDYNAAIKPEPPHVQGPARAWFNC